MRSWSTFKVRAKWADIQDKPTVLVDNQISWDEIINKPSFPGFSGYIATSDRSFCSSSPAKINIGYPEYSSDNNWVTGYFSVNTYWDNSIGKWKRFQLEGNCNASMILLAPGYGILSATNDPYNLNPGDYSSAQMNSAICLSWDRESINLFSKLRLSSVPSSSVGLSAGTVYKDGNGFLKVV